MSALLTTDRRWAIKITVHSPVNFKIDSETRFSVSASKALVASSKITIFGFVNSALAIPSL
jgi:hypothetical protein